MSTTKLTTPIGTAIYPKFQPDYKFDDNGVYSCKLHVSEEDFNKFSADVNEHVERAYKAECDKQGKQKLRRATATPLLITEEGEFEIRTKQPAKKNTSKGLLEFSIGIYDSQGKKLPADTNVGSGSKVRLSVELATWFVASLGFGYTLRLKAGQIIELKEYSGTENASSLGFGAVDGGFISEDIEIKDEESEESNQASENAVPF